MASTGPMSPPSTTVVDEELVSVIVPVRNGAPTLQLVLDGLLWQSYRNIEVLISDNASTDETPAICNAALRRDGRVKCIRHPEPLTAIENFRYWVDGARGRFILYAAHDDLRNRDFIRSLLVGLRNHSEAVCVIPSVSSFSRYTDSPFEVADPVSWPDRPTSTIQASGFGCLRAALRNGFPCYGLLRRDVMQDYPWIDLDYAPDLPLVVYLYLSGDVVAADGATLYYWVPENPKSAAERAVANALRQLAPFPELRAAWAAARMASLARARSGRWFPAIAGFVFIFASRRWPYAKEALFAITPQPLRSFWRWIKASQGWRLN